MEAAIIFLLCAVAAAANAQIFNPLPTMGLGPGWGNSMWHSGMRYPGMMSSSQVNSMTYPTWRSHPLFRMVPTASDKKVDSNVPSDVMNVAKVPAAQEVLTHMALASQNVKPMYDTIADFLYEPQKARTVVSPVTTVTSGVPVSPVVSPVGPFPVSSPVYVQGMNLMRASMNMPDDCGPDGTRWGGHGMDWVY